LQADITASSYQTFAQAAEENDEKSKVIEIRNILKQECVRDKWHQNNHAHQKRSDKSIDTITVEQEGEIVTLST